MIYWRRTVRTAQDVFWWLVSMFVRGTVALVGEFIVSHALVGEFVTSDSLTGEVVLTSALVGEFVIPAPITGEFAQGVALEGGIP